MAKVDTQKEEVRDWMRKIDLSKVWREPYEQVWRKSVDYLKGKFFNELSEEDRICVNMVWPHVRVVIPAIYSRNPDLTVTPRRLNGYYDALAYKRAELLTRVLRYYLSELDIKGEVKLCLLDAILTGHAWVKTCYESNEPVEAKTPAKTLIRELMDGLKGVIKGEQEERIITPNFSEKVTVEKPWVLRSSIMDMFAPALSRRDTELSWLAERYILPHDDVLKNPDWDTTGLKASTNAKELLASLRGYPKGKRLPEIADIEYDIIYEIWDGQAGKTHVVCEGHDRYLDSDDTEYDYLDSKYHPFLMLRMGEVTDEFYPMGDVEPAEPQMKELNEIRTQMNTHRKRYSRKYLAKQGVLDEEGKEGLRSSEDGTVIELTGEADGLLQESVLPIVDATIVPEVYSQESRAREDAYNILGTVDYRNQATGGADTATEAAIQDKQSTTRIGERVDIVNTFILRIIRNLAMIVQKYHSPEQIAEILGGDAKYWKQIIDTKTLRSEYDYSITFGSTVPVSPEVVATKFEKFYNMARGNPMFNPVKLDIELARQAGLEEPETWLNPQFILQLEQQRDGMLRAGLLTEAAVNPLGSTQGPAGGSSQGQGERLPTGQPRGLPGDRGGKSRKGGTALR